MHDKQLIIQSYKSCIVHYNYYACLPKLMSPFAVEYLPPIFPRLNINSTTTMMATPNTNTIRSPKMIPTMAPGSRPPVSLPPPLICTVVNIFCDHATRLHPILTLIIWGCHSCCCSSCRSWGCDNYTSKKLITIYVGCLTFYLPPCN